MKESTQDKNEKPWMQYGLQSALLVMLLVGVFLSGWQYSQFQIGQEFMELQMQLQKKELEIQVLETKNHKAELDLLRFRIEAERKAVLTELKPLPAEALKGKTIKTKSSRQPQPASEQKASR